MEQTTEVNCVEITMICDKCGAGVMGPTGYSYMTSPPKYPHKCNKCGNSDTYRKIYPCIEYRKIERTL